MKLKQLLENQSQFLQTREEIEAWLQKMKIKNYTINDDLTVDVDSTVYIFGRMLKTIPVQFRSTWHFDCSDNQLTSLDGCPREVDGYFSCSYNNLTSLKGAPRDVSDSFFCRANSLTTLKGAPKFVGKHFSCTDNPDLKSLDGIGQVMGEIYSDLS